MTLLLLGAIAQLVSGTLGMGYGIIASALLLQMGIVPIVISASVHTTKMFALLTSGLSHWSMGNVGKSLLWRTLVPGAAGGVAGALFLSVLPVARMRPWVAVVLSAMGVLLIIRSLTKWKVVVGDHFIWPAALLGGFLDAIGGGGWGPVMTPMLVMNGLESHKAVGTANLAGFVVALAEVVTFVLVVGLGVFDFGIMLPMLVGGLVAAPLAAKLCRVVPSRVLGVGVGLFLLLLNVGVLL